MNVPLIKTVCWLTTGLLVAGIAFFYYSFYQRQEEIQSPVDTEYAAEFLNRRDGVEYNTSTTLDYADVTRTMIQMNWTGELPPEPQEQPKVEERPQQPAYKPVAEILALLMIQVDMGRPEQSQVYVRYKGPAFAEDPEASHKVGDHLKPPHDSVVVHGIQADRVEFSFADADRPVESIHVFGQEDAPYVVQVGPDGVRYPVKRDLPKTSRPLETPEKTTLVKRNHYRLGTEDMAYLGENYPSVLTNDLGYRTYRDPKTGRRAGIEITDVRTGSIADRHGAKTGDVLVSINGTPVNSPQEVISYIKTNAQKYTVWEAEFETMGRRWTRLYESSDFQQ